MYASSTASMNMIPFNRLSHVPPQASVPVFLGGWYVCILQLSWSPPSVILNAIVASFASSYCFWYYWSHHLGLAYGFASSQMVFKGETQPLQLVILLDARVLCQRGHHLVYLLNSFSQNLLPYMLVFWSSRNNYSHLLTGQGPVFTFVSSMKPLLGILSSSAASSHLAVFQSLAQSQFITSLLDHKVG